MTTFFNSLLSVTAGASMLIVLVVALSALLGKRYSRKWRYWAWLFIAIRLVLPFDIPLDTSIFTFSVPEESTYVSYVPEQNKAGTTTNSDKIVIDTDKTENVTQTPANPTPVTPPTTISPSENDHIVIPNIPIEDVVDVTPVKTISYTTILMVVWLIGVVTSMTIYAVSHVRFLGRVKLWNRTVTEPWANEIFKNVKLEMCITEDIQLYRNRSVHSPILAGFFKPMILIPTRNLTENDLYMVLRHELLHYKRHDLWYKLLLVLVACLHWFNPFVWFMVKRADRDLEIACDEAVVKGTSMEFRRDYCDTILRIIRCDRGRKPALSTGFTTGKKTMKKRFACALDFTKKRTGVVLLCLVLCMAVLCSTFIACKITKKGPEQYYDEVLYFAERIPQTFNSTSELENSLVSTYLFYTMTNANGYEEDETGAVYITRTEINETAKLILGAENFVPNKEHWMYYAESDSYAFYPAGEGPMYSGEIISSEEKDGILYFTVKLTQKLYGGADEEGYIPPKVYVITYAFTENDNDLYPLKAIKAEYDAEYLASIDVKGIGVLGYVDNAGTLAGHTVEGIEKLSEVNQLVYKKLRVCAFDAQKNGYVVHYYDYTQGDDALNLALTVETIVKGSGLKVNTARTEKSFVVVDLVPTGEEADSVKVKELLQSIACTNNTNGYYLTGFTLSGSQFDFGGITLENDGYGKYDFEPLFNQPITELEFAAMRNLLEYPFTNGIPIYDGTGVAFADGVTDKNAELASLIYYTAECNEYADFSKLSDEDKAAMAIFMVPDTYECQNTPEKWSEVVVNHFDYALLAPLANAITDGEFITKEWVELAVKQLWGEDAEITHPNTTKPKWTYRREAGVYTPFHGGEGSKVLPYIHSVTKTADGYVAGVSYVTANIGGVHGLDTDETLLTYDMFENEEVVELAKRQNVYIVTAKYGDNRKLYLTSCVKNTTVVPGFEGEAEKKVYSYIDRVRVTMTNNTGEDLLISPEYFLQKKVDDNWIEVKYKYNKPNVISAMVPLAAGESRGYVVDLYECFGVLESGHYRLAIPKNKSVYVSNEFYVTDFVDGKIVVADNSQPLPNLIAVEYGESKRYKVKLIRPYGGNREFEVDSQEILMPPSVEGSFVLDGNKATVSVDYCGAKAVIDFDNETFDFSYNFTKSDMETELDKSSDGRYTLYLAGNIMVGDSMDSLVVLYDNVDNTYTYVCDAGGMYGGGFEAGFLRNEDIYCTSLGELKIYNPETKQLALDVGKNFGLGYFEEEKMYRQLLTFRRDPDDFSFIVVYFEVDKGGYQGVGVSDALGTREELPATYKIGYLDKDGNLLESYDTGVEVWLGRYFVPMEVSMRYSADTLTLIVGDESLGFTGTFDRTTHEFKVK